MQGSENNTEETEKNASLVKFRENFIPYMDQVDEDVYVMKWAVFDAKSDPEIDGTTLLQKELKAEISDIPITKPRLEKLADAYAATYKFGSDHNAETAIQNLQEHLGEKDVYEYLKTYGFDEDSPLSFEIKTKQENKYDFEITPDPVARREKALSKETNDQEESAGSVPIGDDEYWLDNDAANLLHSALVYKHKQIQENVKNSFKEVASTLFCFHTAYSGITNAATTQSSTVTMLSTIASLSCIASVSSMTYTAKNSNKDYNKALKIWANLNKNISDPDIPRKEAHQILKNEMRDSIVSFEGIQNIPYSEYRKLKPTLHKEAELKGYFSALNKEDITNTSARLKHYAKELSNRSKLFLNLNKNALMLATKGLSECVTDLFLWNDKTRAKITKGITRGAQTTAHDIVNSGQLKKIEEQESAKKEYNKKALYEFNKQPDIITPELNVNDIKQHKNILDEIPKIQKDKTLAKANFLNVSAFMTSQIIELGYHAMNLDAPNMGKAFYGIAMGLGPYAQTGNNLHDADAVLHSKRVEEAQAHSYIDNEMVERILQNQEEQAHENTPDGPG